MPLVLLPTIISLLMIFCIKVYYISEDRIVLSGRFHKNHTFDPTHEEN